MSQFVEINAMRAKDWALALFEKSVLKQQKWQAISSVLGDTRTLRCLDIGSDNGVISLLLRRQGGVWKSADLDDQTVEAIHALVGPEVYQINGKRTPFADEEFDRVVIVDFLEHIHTDEAFIQELFRIIRPGGELIINVPYVKDSLLRRFRLRLGQTDELHGHVRPGYTVAQLHQLMGDRFKLQISRTYSKFFSQCLDTLIAWATWRGSDPSGLTPSGVSKGTVITEQSINKSKKMYRLYSMLYPLFWLFTRLDMLLVGRSGYMLIAKAKINKSFAPAPVVSISAEQVKR